MKCDRSVTWLGALRAPSSTTVSKIHTSVPWTKVEKKGKLAQKEGGQNEQVRLIQMFTGEDKVSSQAGGDKHIQ